MLPKPLSYRIVEVSKAGKLCPKCGADTFRAEQLTARREPLRCWACNLICGRCKCEPQE